jgi:hypothetical protein
LDLLLILSYVSLTILLSLFLISVLVFALATSLPLVGPLSYVLCSHVQRRMPLMTIALLLNVENLFALALFLLLLALTFVTPFVHSCCFLVACSGLLFQSFVEVIV